jgi:hypothetical protein
MIAKFITGSPEPSSSSLLSGFALWILWMSFMTMMNKTQQLHWHCSVFFTKAAAPIMSIQKGWVRPKWLACCTKVSTGCCQGFGVCLGTGTFWP